MALTIEAGQTRRGVVVDMTSEDSSTNEYVLQRPIHCLLTNHGYCLPDPDTPNRLSVWFTGGTLAPQDVEQVDDWKELFDPSSAPRRDLAEMARVLASRILVGAHLPQDMSEDGSMQYSLRRPIGGHGQVFCDVMYSDESLRVLRGHRGSTFVSTKMPTFS